MIAFDAGSITKGVLYEVQLEKGSYGIMPINSITKCRINQGIYESIIPSISKEDEINLKWPLNAEEESRNENADDNDLMSKEDDLHKIMPLKSFDEIDTKPTVPNEQHNKSTIDELANQLGDCFELMIANLTEIYLQDAKRLSNGVTTFLGATAGMRMLQLEDRLQNSLRSQLIFMHIRNEFQHRLSLMSKHWPTINDYFHTRIGVITGKEEAIAAWVACSYLLRRFYADSTHILKHGLYDELSSLNLFDKGTTFGTTIETALIHQNAIELVRKTGIVYLGGTAIRITFPITGTDDYLNKTIEKNRANIDELSIMDVKYQVYGNSLMCFGLNTMWDRLLFGLISSDPDRQTHLHPCLNNDIEFNRTIESLTSQLCLRHRHNSTYSSKDFKFENYQFKGEFNSEKCYELIHNLIDYDECSKHFMFCASSSLLAPPNNLTFIATSKLYHLTRIFGRSIVNVPYSLYINGMKNWCENELRSVLSRELRKIIIYKHAIQYCFALHYVESMFTNVFQITKEDFGRINFIDKLDKEEIEWSLGYLIGNLDLKARPSVSTFFNKLNNIFILLLTFSPIFIFFSFKEEIKHFVDVIKYKYVLN